MRHQKPRRPPNYSPHLKPASDRISTPFDRVGVVTINYNGAHDTIELIDSLCNVESSSEVVVCIVDNASRSDDRDALLHGLERVADTWRIPLYLVNRHDAGANFAPRRASNTPVTAIVVLKSETNLGFAGGNNLGFDFIKSKCEAVIFINNDMTVSPSILDHLLPPLSYQGVALTTGTIFYYDAPDVIWYGGGRWSYEPALISWHKKKGETKDSIVGGKLQPTPFASGALMAVRPSLFPDGHVFCEGFFFGEEDAELCYRLRTRNFQVLYSPDAVAWHKVGATRKRETANEWRRWTKVHSKHLLMALTLPAWLFYPWLLCFTPYRFAKEAILAFSENPSLRALGSVATRYWAIIKFSTRMRTSASFRASHCRRYSKGD